MEGVLPNLSELSLSSNMLTNACLPHLELICDGALPAITKIDLRHNTIAAFEPEEIGYWRESLPNVSFYF